ncbi:MAG: efflux RND transporter permease subunit, partial [Caulobacterales bacterium]|nr:efflux RND transporter permease subunit [Caulobacterales bacterium]
FYRTGELRTPGGRIELRGDARLDATGPLSDMVVARSAAGGEVRLGDLADIRRGFDDDQIDVTFQGRPTLGFEILIGRSDNIIDVRAAAERVVAEHRRTLPDTVSVDVWADQSSYISQRLALLRNNAVQGLIIVTLLLSLFLNPKLALWVAVGIPVSVAGALFVMRWPIFDYSLNDVTTFGMIIALGILVDDAIVVGESVFEEREKGGGRREATARGVHRVATATIFGVLTTVVAFSPLLTLQDPLGKVLAGFAAVVIFALAFSLFESKFILPAHLAEIRIRKERRGAAARLWGVAQDGVGAGLTWLRDRLYTPAIAWTLTYRYGALAGFAAICFAVYGLMGAGVIRTAFFPEIPGSYAVVEVELDRSASYAMAQQAADRLAASYDAVNARYETAHGAPQGQKLLVAVLGPTAIQVYAELAPEAERDVDTLDFVDAWRAETGVLEGADVVRFTASDDIGGGFAIEATSRDPHALAAAMKRLTERLIAIDGVSNVRDDLAGSRPQIRLRINERGRLLGLTTADVAALIGDEFGGYEIERFLREGEEVRMIARRGSEARASLSDLSRARIRLPGGAFVPLETVASFDSRYVADQIRRSDMRRSAAVFANLDKSQISAPAVFAALESDIAELERIWPGLTINARGELEEEARMQRRLIIAFIATMVMIYVLIAIPLKSYWQPIVIMSVIPFGVVGAALGHWLMGLPMSILSFFGVIALSGIVVNDSLVLLTRYNALRTDGLEVADALREAGRSRLRAIILTTVTTVSGLMPLMLETSEQAQYLKPAAISLAFGEIFATVITLLIVPAVCAIGVDVFGPGRTGPEVDLPDDEAAGARPVAVQTG